MSSQRDIHLANLLSRDEKVLQGERSVLEASFTENVSVYVNWMTHPYFVSFALVFFGSHLLFQPHASDFRTNAIRGLYFAIAVYLLVCSWQLRDSLLVRPHPVFWRVIKGLAFLYAFGLVFLAFQNVGDARHLLSYWDPALGVPLAEKSYATHCDVYTPDDPVSSFRNIYDSLVDSAGNVDVFLLSHVIGWFCKMIMIRDFRLTMLASVLFEIYELSFMHMLPNFRECWWDSLILDIVVCNGLGIVCGALWLRFWKCTEYNFLYHVEVLVDGKVVKKWKPLVSFKYFLGPLIVLGSLAAIELNAFFLKFILWVPPPHGLNFWRIVFWWLLGCAGTRELYYRLQNDSSPFGMMLALIFVNAALESIICFKMSTGLFEVSAPMLVKVPWTIVLSLLLVFAIVYFPFLSPPITEIASGAEGAQPIVKEKTKATKAN